MDWEFVGEPIEVRFEKKPGPPVSFTWRGEEIAISEVLRMWVDHGFGPFRYSGRWWQRRHRNCYRVKTERGEVVELYLDRGKREWVLYRRGKGR
jgi:hypothetical protein